MGEMTKTAARLRGAHLRLVTAGVGVAVVLAGCSTVRDNQDHPLTTLNPKGPFAEIIDRLNNRVFLVAGIVFVLTQGAVIFLAIRFRRRRVDDRPDPVQTHGNPRLEWAWTIMPALLLGGLAVGNVTTIFELEKRAPDAIDITVVGQQWWWEYRYDTDSDGKIDIITANQMVIPAGRNINLSIQSNDVIHSFWIPALNGKKDAVPGRTQTLGMEADEPGLFEGTCTEFCGLSHAYMRMEVKALSPDDYDAWVANQRRPAVTPKAETKAAEGMALFQSRCSMCHQINQFDGDENGALRTDLGITDESQLDGLSVVAPNPDYREGREELTSANAPNLTHLMSRNKFAGNLFDLYNNGQPNEAELRNWLRDPPAKKPMRTDNRQGMPNLALSEDEIDKLVAYLVTLN